MQTDHPNNRQPLLGPEQYSKSKNEWKFRQWSQIKLTHNKIIDYRHIQHILQLIYLDRYITFGSILFNLTLTFQTCRIWRLQYKFSCKI